LGSRWLAKKKKIINMDLSKFSSKAQGLLGKMSEVKQDISEKTTEATQKASQSISTKSTEIKEKVAAFKLEDIINNLKIYEKHFSESELWNKVTKIGKSIGATLMYPVLLLFNLLKSSETDLKEKTMIIGALGYFILPVDLLPDAIAGVGFTDDIAALSAIISALASCVTLEIQEQSKQKCHDLLGDIDDRAIDSVTKLIGTAHDKINKK
jgi:uncharacterized membrane protein YkvA (DUF1232 family)